VGLKNQADGKTRDARRDEAVLEETPYGNHAQADDYARPFGVDQKHLAAGEENADQLPESTGACRAPIFHIRNEARMKLPAISANQII
jgi:hypothetical protein